MLPAAILAAGSSSRIGRPKALLPTATPGETFLSRILATLRAAGLEDAVVVVGPDSGPLDPLLAAGPALVRRVDNPAPERGQLSSLHLALDAIDHPGVAGLLVTLVDVPLVSVATVEALVTAFWKTRAPIVRPAQGSRHGHPVIFDRSVFDDLRRADSSVGAKAAIRLHAAAILDVPVDDEGAFLDVDTESDYLRAFGKPIPRDGVGTGS
jgi:molybdenum cofactor cytidylyltransferase